MIKAIRFMLWLGIVVVSTDLGYQIYKLTRPKWQPYPAPTILYLHGQERENMDKYIFTYDNCLEWNKDRKHPMDTCEVVVERFDF